MSPTDWQDHLGAELSAQVRVVFTRARRTPIQVRPVRGARRGHAELELRMHAMFADAPPEVVRAVTSWVRSGPRAPRATATLDAWIERGLARLPRPAPPPASAARGAHHDLGQLAAELRAREFAADFGLDRRFPGVTWGRHVVGRTRHSLRLGSFDPDAHVVRIHPVLDSVAVPESFVRYVLFHEILHAVHPPRRDAGRRWIHHGREFRRREREYAGYAEAIVWERAHIRSILRAARAGTALAAGEQAAAPRRERSGPVGLVQRLLFAP